MKNSRDSNRNRLIQAALNSCGYRSLPNNGTPFGTEAGYAGQPWNGSFLTSLARTAEIYMHPLVSTTAALSRYASENRVYRNPRPGDLAFYAFGVDGFGQPHVGLVTDTGAWKTEGSFRAVEGMVSSGLPRASTTANGVFERQRYSYDVIGFARPKYPDLHAPVESTATVHIRPSNVAPGKQNARVETIQLALSQTVGLKHAVRGRFDNLTRSAYSLWQRDCGRVGKDADGTPDLETLERLGRVTGLFNAKE